MKCKKQLYVSTSLLGAVKITPAHDHNDFEIGKRHDLPFIQMIDESGIITELTDLKPEYKSFAVSIMNFS